MRVLIHSQSIVRFQLYLQIFTKYQLGWIEQQFRTEITAALEILDLLDEDMATAIIFTEPEEQELLFGVPITDFIGFTACGLNILKQYESLTFHFFRFKKLNRFMIDLYNHNDEKTIHDYLI